MIDININDKKRLNMHRDTNSNGVKFKVGDKVRVIQKLSNWHNGIEIPIWVKEMDKFLNNGTYEITNINQYGAYLDNCFSFALDSLELAENLNPHPNAEWIKKWADGYKIQYYSTLDNKWYNVADNHRWCSEQYRIKPPEKFVTKYKVAFENRTHDTVVSVAYFTKEEVDKYFKSIGAFNWTVLEWTAKEFKVEDN